MNHSTSQPINSSTSEPITHSTIFWKVGILVAVFVFAYFDTILSLIRTWSARDDYSHGFLIPFISIYFIYAKRHRLKHLQIQPQFILGIFFTSAGLLMLVIGSIGGIISIQHLSILITIPGLVLLFLGTAYLRALSLSIVYLAFMIPSVLGIITTRIQWPFQLFSAMIAAKMLNALNMPVFQHSNYLDLPTMTLEVARACSGVNYLVSIIALGIPLAYFTQKTWLRKIVLVASAVIVGIILNPIRVTLIGIWAYRGGEIVHGPLHIFQSLFVSVIGFIFLIIFALILNKIPYRACYANTKITKMSC